MTLGQEIVAARTDSDYTLRELETLTGVSRSHLSAIERGIVVPNVEVILAVAKALQKDPVSWILKASQEGDVTVNAANLPLDARRVFSRLMAGRIPQAVLRQLSAEDGEPPHDDLQRAA